LPPTLVFDHPTTSAITAYISSRMPAPAAARDTPVGAAAVFPGAVLLDGALASFPLAAKQQGAIAVLASALRTAGNNSVLSLNGVDCTARVPFNRWDVDAQQQVCGRCMQAASKYLVMPTCTHHMALNVDSQPRNTVPTTPHKQTQRVLCFASVAFHEHICMHAHHPKKNTKTTSINCPTIIPVSKMSDRDEEHLSLLPCSLSVACQFNSGCSLTTSSPSTHPPSASVCLKPPSLTHSSGCSWSLQLQH